MSGGAAAGKGPEDEVPLVAVRVEGGDDADVWGDRQRARQSRSSSVVKGESAAAELTPPQLGAAQDAAPGSSDKGEPKEERPMTERGLLKFKAGALVVCALHNAAQALCLKYSMGNDVVDSRGLKYITTTAVFTCEVMKVLAALLVIYVTKGGVRGLVREINEEMVQKPVECLKLIIPSALYTLQNNLQFIALANISAAVFQVTSQMKILTTALFTVILLRRTLGPTRWGALLVLTIGCIFVNLDAQQQRPRAADGGEEDAEASSRSFAKQIFGVGCVLTGTVTSGLAGVYFEKMLKGAKTSLWIRQLQLGAGGLLFSLVGSYSSDGARIQNNGFFQGYTPWVWWCVTLNALGGLIVAVVVKYTDNLAKAFAVSASIVIASLVSVPLFGFGLHMLFVIGTFLVILSVFLYESIVLFNVRTNVPLAFIILTGCTLIFGGNGVFGPHVVGASLAGAAA